MKAFKLADISSFESLGNCCNKNVPIHNSDAAVMLQDYDHAKRSELLCGKYIEDLQKEDFIPAELISTLYESKEKFNTQCMNVRQQLVAQAQREPLDQFDREIFVGLSKESQSDLEAIMEADEVYQRALEMQQQQNEEQEVNRLNDEMPPEAGPEETGNEAPPELTEEPKEEKPAPKPKGDISADVSSEEDELQL